MSCLESYYSHPSCRCLQLLTKQRQSLSNNHACHSFTSPRVICRDGEMSGEESPQVGEHFWHACNVPAFRLMYCLI
jgi:hypothetical protein